MNQLKTEENENKERNDRGEREKVGDSIISPRRAGIRSRPIDPGKSARRHPQVVDARFWNEFQGFRLVRVWFPFSRISRISKTRANRRIIISGWSTVPLFSNLDLFILHR
jgi:hypothetical protein